MSRLDFSVDYSVYEGGRKAPQYTLDTDLRGELSLADFVQQVKSDLIVIADQILREEQARGFDPSPVVVVDGRVGKPVYNVKPFGQIEFIARGNMKEIILETYEGIIHRSPVDTGQYIKYHFVFLNGKQVASDRSSLNAWLASDPKFKDTDLIRFVNTQPYARKLERLGVTAQRQQSRSVQSRDKRGRSGTKILVPNGTYFLTTRAIKRKYKRNTSVKFGFIPGTQLGLTAAFRSATSGARGGGSGKLKKPGRTYLYPSITILVSEGGIA